MSQLNFINQGLFDFIAPNQCLSCRQIISPQQFWCHKCWHPAMIASTSSCTLCAKPIPNADYRTQQICASCTESPPPWQRLIAPLYYTGSVPKIIKQLKYQRQIYLSKKLAQLMYHYHAKEFKAIDMLIPIPMHWFKLLRRGFNQANLIASELSKITNISKLNALGKKRYTVSQTHFNRQTRLANLADSITINPDIRSNIKGRNIGLVDDVITTGATFDIASSILIDNGAKSVTAIAVAATPKPHWQVNISQ